MSESLAAFTPDQLQLIGTLVVSFGAGFIVFIWRVATWKANLENDVDNLGYILKTPKGIARHEKKMKGKQ